MQIQRNIKIEGGYNKPILLDIYQGEPNKPLVIFSHGFKGFKDWGHFDYVAKAFQEKGLNFIKFNFSHNGTTVDDPTNFGDLEAFGNNNFTIELDDLQKVIDWGFDNLEFSELVLMGHSRGGGTVMLKAAEESRVNKIITWAAISNIKNRFSEAQITQWEKDKVTFVENARTNQQMPLYYQLYENFINNFDRLNVENAVKSFNVPHLIIHGTEDDAVGINEAFDLNEWSRRSDLITLQGADHTFGAKHPFNEDQEELHIHAIEVINDSIRFILD